MKNVFYSTDISPRQIRLDAEESAHAMRVLRMKTGDEIWITNGLGSLYQCEITETGKKEMIAGIVHHSTIEKPAKHIHLAIAPTKNADRLEWLVEKLTETGISEITPILCNYAERKVLKTDRLKKMALTAMKQSKQCWLPVINELTPFTHFCQTTGAGQKFIAHCQQESLPDLRNMVSASGSDFLLCIGPEGDFSPTEIALAKESGFKEVSLGNTRLRTETAGLVGIIALQTLIR